jgi:hypothetical protein
MEDESSLNTLASKSTSREEDEAIIVDVNFDLSNNKSQMQSILSHSGARVVLSRGYAAGARQGSSIANVKMVRYGRFQIPVRLLKRWLQKQERTKDATEVKSVNPLHVTRTEAAKRVTYDDVSAPGSTTAQIAAFIEDRRATIGAIKRSWFGLLLHAARSPDDWTPVEDAWLRFAADLNVVDSLAYSRLMLQAAIRCTALPRFVDMLRADGLARLTLSVDAAKLLLYCAPADNVPVAFATLLHRQSLLAQSRKLLAAALLRAEEPGAASIGPVVARLLRELPQGDAKPEFTAAATLRARLTASNGADSDAIVAEALALNTTEGRAIAALATLVAHGDSGVGKAVTQWNNATSDVALLTKLFGRRIALYPAAAPAIEKFLSSVVGGDAAVVGKIKADGEAWHQDRPNRIARAIDIEAAASETKQQ